MGIIQQVNRLGNWNSRPVGAIEVIVAQQLTLFIGSIHIDITATWFIKY
jgi:hypothetical protein